MSPYHHPRPPGSAPPQGGPQLLTIREVLDRLRVSRSTFYQLVKDQKIPLRKIGGASRIRSDELEAFIQELPLAAEEPFKVSKLGGDA